MLLDEFVKTVLSDVVKGIRSAQNVDESVPSSFRPVSVAMTMQSILVCQ